MNAVGNCPLCGSAVEAEETVAVPLEMSGNTEKVCENCCANVMGALIEQRTVKVGLQDGVIQVEVL